MRIETSTTTSSNVKESELVQFVSGITGKDVDVTAEKITADLDAITGRVTADERVETQRPTSSKSDESWNVGASFSVGKDGVPNPALSFSYQEDGVRTSGIFSSDLLYGLKKIGNWLHEKFIGDDPKEKTTKPTDESQKDLKKEKRTENKKTKDEKPTKQQYPDEPKPGDDQRQQIKTKNEQVIEKVNSAVKAKLDEILANEKLTPEQKAKVIESAQKDMRDLLTGDRTTQEKILARHQYNILQAQDALDAQNKNEGFFSKLWSATFGARTAHADGGTTIAIGVGMGATGGTVAISPLAASGIGLLFVGIAGGAIALENAHPGFGKMLAQAMLGIPLVLKNSDGSDDSDFQAKIEAKKKAFEAALDRVRTGKATPEEQLEILKEHSDIIAEIFKYRLERQEKIEEFEEETKTKPQAKAGDRVEVLTDDPSSLNNFVPMRLPYLYLLGKKFVHHFTTDATDPSEKLLS